MDYVGIKTLKKQTEFILQNYPHTRNDDRALVKLVCETFGHDPIAKATSIERCRRWFNQRGKYLPTDERVVKKRKINIQEWRAAMGYPTETGDRRPPSEINKPKKMEFVSKTQRNTIYQVIDIGSTIICNCPSYKYRGTCWHVKEYERQEKKRRLAALNRLF